MQAIIWVISLLALQASLYPDYGHRMPRSAAGPRDLALVQFTSNPRLRSCLDHRRANQTKAGINDLYIIMGQVHALVEMIVPSNEDGDIKMTPPILDQITAIQDAACDALDLPHMRTIPLPRPGSPPQKSPPEEQS